MIRVLSVILFLFSIGLNAQIPIDSTLGDSKYLEDQFYVGVTYNFLLNKPESISQRNLSYGIQAGLIKDIPLNKNRTAALGIGLGYGLYSYYSNLRVRETQTAFEYSVLENETDFKRNKVETHMLEVPLEFRWRNSNPVTYKFWRIYTGLKLGYVVGGRSKYIAEDASENASFYNTDIRKFQYGLTFNFGYNTFNLQAYYALNNLFNDGTVIGGEDIALKPLRIGLIFYIL